MSTYLNVSTFLSTSIDRSYLDNLYKSSQSHTVNKQNVGILLIQKKKNTLHYATMSLISVGAFIPYQKSLRTRISFLQEFLK